MPRVNGWWLLALGAVVLVILYPAWGGTPAGIGLLGALAFLFLIRTLRWSATTRWIPRRLLRPRPRRSGVALVSALIGLTLLGFATAMTVQVVFTVLAARERQAAQVQALAAAASALEQARVSLSQAASAYRTAAPSNITLVVAAGPAPSTATVTARAPLPTGGAVALTTIVPHKGPLPAAPAGSAGGDAP